MANCIHMCSSCQLWSVSGGIWICLQNYSSTSGSRVMRVWSFADFQASGWKPGCFFPCPSNVVTALANGAIGGSSWKLVSVLPCPSNIATALANGAMQGVNQARQLVSGVSNRSQARLLLQFSGVKISNVCISAPRLARADLTAYLDT